MVEALGLYSSIKFTSFCKRNSLLLLLVIDSENIAKKSVGRAKNLFPEVAVAVTFLRKTSRSTDLKMRFSAVFMKVGRFVTKDVSVFSQKS